MLSLTTKLSTVFYGPRTISWLQTHLKEEFAVYCWDDDKSDFSITWVQDIEFVGQEDCIRLAFDNGVNAVCSKDQKILSPKGEWVHIKDIQQGSSLMPFYKVDANYELTQNKENQFPRIYSINKGWMHERQFVDEWKLGKDLNEYEEFNKICRFISDGLSLTDLSKMLEKDPRTINSIIEKKGFSYREIQALSSKPKTRRVIGTTKSSATKIFKINSVKNNSVCGESCVFLC